MGRWSAAHWKTATFGWLVFVVVAFGLGGMVSMKTIDPNTSGPGESGRMDRILEAGFKQPAAESVLIQSRSLRTTDPAFRAAIEDVVSGVSALRVVQNVRSPLEPGNAGQIAEDGHAALVEFQIRGDADKASEKIDAVVDRVEEVQEAHPQLYVGEFGKASATSALDTVIAEDLEKAGLISLPDHADHPRGRVRGAGRGGHSAAPRSDRGVRDVRARCRCQPGDAARRGSRARSSC